MIVKNILRIFKDYRFSIILVLLYEIIYIFKGYKGNTFNFSKNNKMSDDIPTTFYFLSHIKNYLQINRFNRFIDLGCGSGRVIFFLSRFFKNKKYVGVEYYFKQYNFTKNLFKSKKNITILNKDFTYINFLKYNADCYFFNNPFKSERVFISFITKLISRLKGKKNITFIFVNFHRSSLLKINDLTEVSSLHLSPNKGLSIYKLN